MTIDHLLHVAVLLAHLERVGRARIILHHVLDDGLEQDLLLLQPFLGEVADDQGERRLFQRALDADRVQKALLARGRLRRAALLGQALDDGGGDLDRVLHLPLGIAGMGADAVDGDGGPVGRESLVLDAAGALAVHGVSEIGAQLLQIDVVDAAAVILVTPDDRNPTFGCIGRDDASLVFR